MVFAIRHLILRSRIPNYNIAHRAAELRLNSPSFSHTPRTCPQRSFSALSRYQQDDKAPKNDSPGDKSRKAVRSEDAGRTSPKTKNVETTPAKVDVKATPEIITTSPEPSAEILTSRETAAKDSIPPEPNAEEITNQSTQSPTISNQSEAPTTSQSKIAEVVEDEDDEPINITETEKDAVEKWKKDIKLSDEELAYFVNTYPGIDAETITAVKTGRITESQIVDGMEADLSKEELDLLPEQRHELAKLQTDMEGVGQAIYGDDESLKFSDEELEMLGLNKEDMEAMVKEDSASMSKERALRITEAMKRVGISENDIRGMVEETDEGEEEDEESARELASVDAEQDMSEGDQELDDGGQPLDPEIDAFLKSPESAGLSNEEKNLFQRALRGDVTALEQMLESLSPEERAELEAITETDESDPEHDLFERAMQGDEAALDKMMESFSPEERGELDALVAKGADVPGFGRATKEVATDLAPEQEAQLRKEMFNMLDNNPEVRAHKNHLGEQIRNDVLGQKDTHRLLKTSDPSKPLSPDELMAELEAEGIDPAKMNEKDFMLALEKKLTNQPSFTETDDGDIIRVHNVGSKEELAQVRRQIARGSDRDESLDGWDGIDMDEKRPKTKYEMLMEERAVDPKRYPGESDERYMERQMGFLTQEQTETVRREREDPGFFNYGEEGQGVGEDEEFQGDDLSAAGHAEVEQHRELREYARLAAWELPLLHSTSLCSHSHSP
jgi:hypothetical protein